MKKMVLIFGFTLSVLSLHSQTFNFYRVSEPVIVYSDTFGIMSEGRVINLTNDTVPLRLIRTSVNTPQGWENCICDILQCHPMGVDTAIAGYPPGSSPIFVMIEPHFIPGTGYVTIRAERISNTGENYYATFGGSYYPIGINIISNEIPNVYSLSQNYPNPFNPATKIRFAIPKSSFAALVVYDMLGREVERLVNEQLNAGTYEVGWSADKFSSGVYCYKLVAEDYSEIKKMVLLK